MARSGAQILVDQLILQQVSDVFCIPGESYLAVLDALYDAPIRITTCRQEGGAAMMADVVGRFSNRPGICFVTRGPGAMNAAAGLHIAQHDSIPLILFVGQIERKARERGAFQEVDYRAVFGSICKWVTEIDDAARIPEIISRAFSLAMSGRPGPVVIALPEDMLTDFANVPDAPLVTALPASPSASQMAQLSDILTQSRQPILLLGGTRWSEEAVQNITKFAEKWQIPVAVSFRRQMLFSAHHPLYAGDLGIGANPALLDYFRSSDCIIALGARLSEIPSQGYTLLDLPGDGTRLIHIYPDEAEIGRLYAPRLGIIADPLSFSNALAQLAAPASPLSWAQTATKAHQAYLTWVTPPSVPGPLQMGEIIEFLQEKLPDDAILTNGAGNYAIWLHRFYRFRRFGTQAAPTSGSMGFGVPAAIAAKRLYPERMVVCFAGDGCFLMHGQEFATAVQYNLAVIIIVIDNGMYGTIRMHQEREYPARVSATSLTNPDFAAYARAFGGYGERISQTEEFQPAFERAIASGQPAILHCLLDPEAITPTTTLQKIRETALLKKI